MFTARAVWSILFCTACGRTRPLCRTSPLCWNRTAGSLGSLPPSGPMRRWTMAASCRCLNVGPLCIAPEMQRQGLGRLLLDTALQKAAERGFGAAVLEGDPAFYGPSGFVPGKTVGIRYADDPEADYFLVKELRPGFLQGKHGIYRDPAGYFVCLTRPQEFADFEAQFPAK